MTGEPTLGCQIAPHYDHEQWPYDSDSDSEENSGEGSVAREEVAEESPPDIEKTETQADVGPSAPASRPTTLQRGRTKSSRKESQQEPVGFWHWSMVG